MNNKVLWVLIIILSIIIVERTMSLLSESIKKEIPLPAVESLEPEPFKNVYSEPQTVSDSISFAVNSPENFNDKTKQDIYDLRKRYVANSPLYPENYEPSDEVFGQIVSSKPWYGKYERPCQSLDKNDTSRGESLLSSTLNNPNALIAPFMPLSYRNRILTSDFCMAHDAMLFMPSKIIYKPERKLLEITYPLDKAVIGKNHYNEKMWLLLIALNARDAGYNYITSTRFVNGAFYDSIWNNYTKQYQDNENISNIVFKFNDYIHLGTSCGLAGGCNNISPRQMAMEFDIWELPARLELKLWKKQPSSRNAAPDLYCNLIFE
ncbi:MAG: hypothetical protein NC390_02715 [Fusobacterium sp.]|nr:hypothetical protein [Fusobacterium sp.]